MGLHDCTNNVFFVPLDCLRTHAGLTSAWATYTLNGLNET
eukprot:CAMPEP_0178693482 /NCGR_PEP_ID=MMETSP0699-20121125/7735_1 /TAXON_ID=265572 /ORGANISM="Extubocellulus spinifer, Strain CCMP396" /LENGTH=39 /DNA_ID= /DNA_START= /DNA_END= /DNA_ORIENTATION=